MMTEQEMRELDAWIAEHCFGWRQIEAVMINGTEYGDGPYWWPPDYGDPLDPLAGATIHAYPPRYSWDAYAFRSIKREIERRGWDWGVGHYHSRPREKRYNFMIYGGDKRLGHEYAETEEFAGCLAFRQAVETTDGSKICADCGSPAEWVLHLTGIYLCDACNSKFREAQRLLHSKIAKLIEPVIVGGDPTKNGLVAQEN